MNLRSVFLSSIVLLGLGAAFGFKSEKRVNWVSDWIYSDSGINQCIKTSGAIANEPICSPWNTGPVCTVTPGVLSTRTAYYPNSNCTLPWRQP